MLSLSLQIGPNARELFRLVEDFIDVIGFRMKDFRDSYQVTDNLGELICTSHVGQRPQEAVITVQYVEPGLWGGEAARGGMSKGLEQDMDDHKYGVAFLQMG